MATSHAEQVTRPSTSVREIRTQDGALLLDIDQGLCLSLTPVAATIWQLLSEGRSLDQITDRISATFEAPKDTVVQDLKEFMASLSRRGLLGREAKDQAKHPGHLQRKLLRLICEPHPSGPQFLFWKALLGLSAFDVCRFGSSFTVVHELVRDWPIAPGAPHPNAVQLVCQAVNCACVVYPKSILCLQRSVISTLLLRSHSVSAQMVIGAQKLPFKAHAWTEVNGTPINERRDVRNVYLVWERC